jgi:hypothetical protein
MERGWLGGRGREENETPRHEGTKGRGERKKGKEVGKRRSANRFSLTTDY